MRRGEIVHPDGQLLPGPSEEIAQYRPSRIRTSAANHGKGAAQGIERHSWRRLIGNFLLARAPRRCLSCRRLRRFGEGMLERKIGGVLLDARTFGKGEIRRRPGRLHPSERRGFSDLDGHTTDLGRQPVTGGLALFCAY